MVRLFISFALLSLVAGLPAQAQMSGIASVTDGDTLRIRGPSASGSTASTLPSPRRAAAPAARPGLAAQPPPGPFASASPAGRSSAPSAIGTATGRIVAVCRIGGADVNAWMVEQGWAVAYRKYSTDYVSHETAAKAARWGLWRGRVR